MRNYGYCPKCFSGRLIKRGQVWSGLHKVQCYKCQDCGHSTLHPLPAPPDKAAATTEPPLELGEREASVVMAMVTEIAEPARREAVEALAKKLLYFKIYKEFTGLTSYNETSKTELPTLRARVMLILADQKEAEAARVAKLAKHGAKELRLFPVERVE